MQKWRQKIFCRSLEVRYLSWRGLYWYAGLSPKPLLQIRLVSEEVHQDGIKAATTA